MNSAADCFPECSVVQAPFGFLPGKLNYSVYSETALQNVVLHGNKHLPLFLTIRTIAQKSEEMPDPARFNEHFTSGPWLQGYPEEGTGP